MPGRHVPVRTCIGCGQARPKRELIRVVRTPEGEVVADATGRRAGRGAYLDPSAECLEKGLAGGALSRALETTITEEQRARLGSEVSALARERQKLSAVTHQGVATTPMQPGPGSPELAPRGAQGTRPIRGSRERVRRQPLPLAPQGSPGDPPHSGLAKARPSRSPGEVKR